ncbi:MAG: hypothetical protein AAF799_36230 [Myxococcota bacterium]
MNVGEACLAVEAFMHAFLKERSHYFLEASDVLEEDWAGPGEAVEMALVAYSAEFNQILVMISVGDPLEPDSMGPTMSADECTRMARTQLSEIAAQYTIQVGATGRWGAWETYRRDWEGAPPL